MGGMTLDDFLGHKQNTGGGFSKQLTNWKKRTPPKVDTLLHKNSMIHSIWRHNIPKFVTKKDETQVHVWGGDFVCHESEAVLQKQYLRDRDTGERVEPPRICPICLLNEKLRELIETGAIEFTDPVFKFEGDFEKETKILHAGGMFGGFTSSKITDEEKAMMKSAGLRQSEAWKENVNAKCHYVFSVLDVSDLEAGVQVAVEGSGLGDKVKEVIGDTITALGSKDGNPMLTPYVIRWQHVPAAKSFGDKYKAIRLPKIEVTPEMEDLISGEAPNVDNLLKPFDLDEMRAHLEEACQIDLDWDEIFGPAEKFYGSGGGAAKKNQTTKRAKKAAEEIEESEEETDEDGDSDDKIECPACGSMIDKSVDECPVCGEEFDDGTSSEEDEDEEDEPPPPPKKASKKKTSKKKTSKKKTAKKTTRRSAKSDDMPID